MQGYEKDDWDKDTDEINSLDSDELHESRPNRWTGNEATWRTLTEDDTKTYRAFEAVRNQDLAAHLYNTFALRNQGDDEAASRDKVKLTMPVYDICSWIYKVLS
jgi:hypothetical protein